MPQASDEDREKATKMWGDIGCEGPVKFLEDRGWTLTPAWEWIRPLSDRAIADDEWFAIAFLVQEWDFGGLVAPLPVPAAEEVMVELRTVVIRMETGLSLMDRLRVLLGYEIKQVITLVCEFPPGRCQSSCETYVEGLRRAPKPMEAKH